MQRADRCFQNGLLTVQATWSSSSGHCFFQTRLSCSAVTNCAKSSSSAAAAPGLGGVFLQTGKTQSFVVVGSSSGHGYGSVGHTEHEQNSRLAPVGPRGGSAEVHTGRDSCFSPDVGLGHSMGGGHTGRPPPVQIFPSRRAILSQFMHSGTGSRITPMRFIDPHALP